MLPTVQLRKSTVLARRARGSVTVGGGAPWMRARVGAANDPIPPAAIQPTVPTVNGASTAKKVAAYVGTGALLAALPVAGLLVFGGTGLVMGLGVVLVPTVDLAVDAVREIVSGNGKLFSDEGLVWGRARFAQ